TSVKLPQVLTTPTTKNNTRRAYPIACSAPWILAITFQMSPPLKFSGDWVMICQISASLLFHVSRAFLRFWTTQLSLKTHSSFLTRRADCLSSARLCLFPHTSRSEERRVGKEWRSSGSWTH